VLYWYMEKLVDCGLGSADCKVGGEEVADTYAHNALHTFPRNFPVDGEAANLLQTCYEKQV